MGTAPIGEKLRESRPGRFGHVLGRKPDAVARRRHEVKVDRKPPLSQLMAPVLDVAARESRKRQRKPERHLRHVAYLARWQGPRHGFFFSTSNDRTLEEYELSSLFPWSLLLRNREVLCLFL